MDVRVGFLILLMLIGNWACEARHMTTSDSAGLEKDNQKADLCTLCKEYSSLAIEHLNDNQTQKEILNALHDACSHMYSLEQECITLVDYYATLVFTEVSSVTPEELCEIVKVCQEAKVTLIPMKGDKCDACHHAVDEFIVKLKDPDTKLEIIEILLKLCNTVDKDHVKQCKSLVFEYGPLILANAEKFLEKTDLCTTFHACSSSMNLKDEVELGGRISMVTSS